jgi:hypothetical protein
VEDECLDDTWKSVSIDPISDANQNYGTYWERVKVVFDERKLFDPEFNKVHMDRNMSRVGESFKWHGIQQKIMEHQESCTNIDDLVSRASLLAGWHCALFSYCSLAPISCVDDQDVSSYHSVNDDIKFKFIHVFKRIETCDKRGRGDQASLGKEKDAAFDPTAVLPVAGKGHPVMGNKKIKLARDEAPVMERLQSSIDKCITGVAMNNAAMEEKYDAWWAMMFEKQEVKIGLLKTNVLAIKRKEDLALLTTDTSSMCAGVKA